MDHFPKKEWPRATLTLKKGEGLPDEAFTVIGYSVVPPGAPEGFIMLQFPSGGIEFRNLKNYEAIKVSPEVQAIIANNARREQQQHGGRPPEFSGPSIIKPN